MQLRHYDKILWGLFSLIILYGLFGILRIYPTIYSFYISFYKYNLIRGHKVFIGLSNYIKLFQDPSFIVALRNTFLIAVVTVPAIIVLAFALAVFYDKKFKLHSFFELVFFAPAIMPTAAVALIWKWMYETQGGLINHFLSFLGISPIPWLSDPHVAIWAIMIMWIWKWVGYYAILFKVGLQNIPKMYTEAATIDGATAWQNFYHITLPLLKPASLFAFVICTAGAFQMFVPVYILTVGAQGAFTKAVKVIVYDMYTNYFTYWKVGYAAAEGTILFVMLLIMTYIEVRSLRSY